MYDPSDQLGPAIPVKRSPSLSSSSEPEMNTFGAHCDANPKIPIDAQQSSADPSTIQTANAPPGSVQSEGGASKTMPPSYFDEIYEKSIDPWNFETSEYEASKYRLTLACLPNARYRRGLEIGCSIGVLTRQLASRCDEFLGVDVSRRALAMARERCANLPQVHFRRVQVPAEMPDGPFDLVILSEVVYFWQRKDLERAADLLTARQPPGAHLVLVHYTPHVPDFPLTGDEVHDAWLARSEWRLLRHERRDSYRLDVLEKKE